ncbi:MAG: NADH-quinone oxidoreductase subunit C [Thermoproteota archaeon]|nr:NADH-quinone oxidoreductase subunit C [Thermoproteota archaeon]
MSTNNKEEVHKPAATGSQPKQSSSNNNTAEKSPPPAPSASPQPKPISSKPTAPSPAASPPAAAAKPGTAASPPKKEPEPPAFEKGLVDEIRKKFGDLVKVVFIKPLRIKIQVDPNNIVEVATFLRDSMGFDHAESVAGTDYPKDNQIEVVYHLGSYSRENLGAHILGLTARTSRDDARLPTLINVYKSVEYHERECYEMLGVYFEGHPRNERFLLPEDWADIPPLRKDFRIKGR